MTNPYEAKYVITGGGMPKPGFAPKSTTRERLMHHWWLIDYAKICSANPTDLLNLKVSKDAMLH